METAILVVVLVLSLFFFGGLRLAQAGGRRTPVRRAAHRLGWAMLVPSVLGFVLFGPAARAGVWQALGLDSYIAILLIALLFVISTAMLVSVGLDWLYRKCRSPRATPP